MINTYEAIGIGASIIMMVLALFLLNVDEKTLSAVVPESQTQTAAVVVVNDGDGQNQDELARALVAAYDGMDTLQKVVVDDVVLGGGAEAVSGKTVRVHYVGRLENGQEFDNSEKRSEPFEFTIGAGEVISGWEEGLVGMKEGGERTLVIPPQFGYGNHAVGPIPANATLLFSIKLIDVI